MTDDTKARELPPLPAPCEMGYYIDSVMRRGTVEGYTSEQMRAYAEEAILAALSEKERGGQVPVDLRKLQRYRKAFDFNSQSDYLCEDDTGSWVKLGDVERLIEAAMLAARKENAHD